MWKCAHSVGIDQTLDNETGEVKVALWFHGSQAEGDPVTASHVSLTEQEYQMLRDLILRTTLV